MDVIKLTRELGLAIQQDADYLALLEAKKANDEDAELQKLIGEFNLYSASLDHESEKEAQDDAKIDELRGLIQATYDKAMANENMNRFEQAKEVIDGKMNTIVAILAAAVNGEDPMTFDPQEHSHDHGCGGDCSCCHGC